MSADTGFNQTVAQDAVELIIDTEADVRLLTDAVAYDDGDADIDTKEVDAASYDRVTVPEADWGISFDVANGELTLENDAEVDFGEAEEDWGTVVDVVIQAPGTDQFIRADEPNDPEITAGESVSFPVGEITYTLGP